MIKHSKYYYETDRNGYNTSKTWQDEVVEDKNNKWEGGLINPKMLLSKEELMKEEKEPKLNFDWHLDKVSKQITDLLKSKNKAYGNTALNPSNVFSKLDSTEAICARLDDKLARIQNKGINDKTEDTVDDIIGYLLLLKMSMEK